RGLAPETGARSASLAYPIKYAQAFNEGDVFVFDPANRTYVLEKDLLASENNGAALSGPPLSSQPVASVADEYPPIAEEKTPDADTAFHHLIHTPARLVLPAKEKDRNALLESNPALKA